MKELKEIRELEEKLREEERQGYKVVIVDGWVGLGVCNCHRQAGFGFDEFERYKLSILIFQKEIKKLLDKYPQLKGELTVEMLSFLEIEIIEEIYVDGGLGWLKEIMVEKIKEIRVDNVYMYYSKSDKELIFHLRILLKALLD